MPVPQPAKFQLIMIKTGNMFDSPTQRVIFGLERHPVPSTKSGSSEWTHHDSRISSSEGNSDKLRHLLEKLPII